MISLIICSTDSALEPKLVYNIKETIGCEYEIILIDNSENKYSIFEAYNMGVKRSQYSICCFMHQDILYHTKDWGLRVFDHFKDEKVGMIGVAGTTCLLKAPSSWSTVISAQEINIIQHDGNEIISILSSSTDAEVAAVDGVWFCIKKALFKKIHFDETFSGFHFYDLDISLQVRAFSKKVLVVKNIQIEHFSIGSKNTLWILNSLLFYSKWSSNLPINIGGFNKRLVYDYEMIGLKKLWGLLSINRTYKSAYKILLISINILGLKFLLFFVSNFRIIFHCLRKYAFHNNN